MLPAYILTVDITTVGQSISYEEFREQVAPYLTCLDALRGVFHRSPCSITYYPPEAPQSKHELEEYSVRAVVVVSIGKQRAEYLNTLYDAVVRLIMIELSHFEVKADLNKFQFS
ncbi:hypothetical protein ACUXZJ_12070 [Flavobacterium sp. TN-1]